jgi:hypothetical protein
VVVADGNQVRLDKAEAVFRRYGVEGFLDRSAGSGPIVFGDLRFD